MANRKERRNKGKNVSVREEQEIKNLILTIFILALIFGLMYLFTAVILKRGLLSKGYTKQIAETPIVDYETATIGTVFDKVEEEYYVVFDEFSSNPSKYLESILSNLVIINFSFFKRIFFTSPPIVSSRSTFIEIVLSLKIVLWLI